MQALLDDESIEEIWINSPNRIFIARDGRTELVPLIMSAQEIRDSVERLLAWSGRRVDLSQPFVDARLPNGSRLHVVIPDITAEFWSINIRKRALRAFTLDDLVSADSVTTNLAELLRLLINSHINVLVSGATQAGKTTILNCLLGELPITSRLITIEEVFELMPRVADHVAMQTRQANLEGEGEVTLRMLVRESLRMRPTHIVIGEVRGAEALDLLLALNSGIPGMASIHANSPLDALKKISALPLLVGANIVREFAIDAVRANVDLVIHCERDHSGKRRVMELSLVQKNGPSDSFWVDKLISWTGDKYLLSPVDLDSYPKVKVALEEFLIHTKASARL
jgi:pilus assembly protein CpaF